MFLLCLQNRLILNPGLLFTFYYTKLLLYQFGLKINKRRKTLEKYEKNNNLNLQSLKLNYTIKG